MFYVSILHEGPVFGMSFGVDTLQAAEPHYNVSKSSQKNWKNIRK